MASSREKPFEAAAWEDDEYIVSGNSPDKKSWEAGVAGMTLSKRDALVVVYWLNSRVSPADLRLCADLLESWRPKA